MKSNNIYFLATLLDPRVKTQQIKDNLNNANIVIKRLRTFLKATYYHEVKLPSINENDLYKSLEYRFLKPYAININIDNEYDIN